MSAYYSPPEPKVVGSNPAWRIAYNFKPCGWLLVCRAFLFLVGRPQVVALIVACGDGAGGVWSCVPTSPERPNCVRGFWAVGSDVPEMGV